MLQRSSLPKSQHVSKKGTASTRAMRNASGPCLRRRRTEAADVWKKDVWDFQAFSQTFFELRFSIGNEGKDCKNSSSQTWPGTPRRPSPRHPRPPLEEAHHKLNTKSPKHTPSTRAMRTASGACLRRKKEAHTNFIKISLGRRPAVAGTPCRQTGVYWPGVPWGVENIP